jgi:chromosome segregation protein
MLKALELVGFKSFADKTRFEFPPGITVVVGPNGSGKSNIVDSIKWVLGEQSVKSLRGHEMADVIFNGSNTRRAMNSCEITLTFDNSKRLFGIDASEVHITRRVYRGGEGEYLINRNPVRLRDIRDLISGTGMGSQAYSVIEQGKVDVLLQTSARDRRAIFEEAAGISRFKLKKVEALRRLERVDQNLLRLKDIVAEVENRLRSVRLQAGKARKYKEYADRLQELRTWVALVDWRRLSQRLDEYDKELQTLRDERDAANASAEALEAGQMEIDAQSSELRELGRQAEARIAANRERIAASEASIEYERGRLEDLELEIARLRRQLMALSARAGDAGQQLQDTIAAVETADGESRQIGLRLTEGERALTEVMSRLDHLRNENQQRRADYVEKMRSAAALGNELSGLESRAVAAEATRRRCRERLAELEGQRQTLSAEIESLRLRQRELAEEAQNREAALRSANEQLAALQTQRAALQEELGALRQRKTGAAERAAVLEELENRREGISSGVKEVLEAARSDSPGPYNVVCGLVADVLSAHVEAAPLVDVALGQASQHVVVDCNDAFWAHLEDQSRQFSGRVGFLRLEGRGESSTAGEVNLEGRPGVRGRADRFVETQSRFKRLAVRLLGTTWIVENLADALRLSKEIGAGQNFVTLAGELVSADGAVVVGPRNATTGLISRRSQLRALRTQLEEMEVSIRRTAASAAEAEEKIVQQRRRVEDEADEHRRVADAQSECRMKLAASEERGGQLDQQRSAEESELRGADAEHDAAAGQIAEIADKHRRCEAELAEMELQLTEVNEQIDRLESERQNHNRETTQTKVELAKSEERLHNLRSRQKQFEETRQERRHAIDDAREQLSDCIRRTDAARQNILKAESDIAVLYLHKETIAAEVVSTGNRLESLLSRHSELAAEAQKSRAKARKLDEKIHAQDLASNEVRLQRGALADRLREEYGTELAELEVDASVEKQQQREQVQQEIDDLRRKLNNLGNVNLESLDELKELEERFELLSGQYNDLSDAKGSLEKIIQKINADSRRLFAETLETVKGHFQTLFRDLFGGGSSDILLEEGVDILESGVEIVARPPGKELRSISLLSGGEKTLTCVALLLAIFRSHPSPFCVLDEVDAALDEVNIDRFTQVLQDFLTWTQFIIVTHSKKTMTAANSIYGVTMQESGISKQVSVRFEDVSDDGRIIEHRPSASEEAA